MTRTPISFASIFTKDNDPDHICSICFFIFPDGLVNPTAITNYLTQRVIPDLAQKIPNSDADSISFAIRDSMGEMEGVFGAECQGVLTDYNLSICAKA